MPVLILLIIAFFVWRHFTRKRSAEHERIYILEARVRQLEAELYGMREVNAPIKATVLQRLIGRG